MSNTQDNELMPCPFCGGGATIEQTGRNEITIKCPKCVIKYTQRVKRNSLEWLKTAMIEKWNTRVENPQSPNEKPPPDNSNEQINYLEGKY